MLYTVWSLVRHNDFQTGGYDLGIFEQAVRSYSNGHWPRVDLIRPGFPLLGDHFHPILALLAPLYHLWPAPELLLVAQGLLVSLSAVPVCRCAIGELGLCRGTMVGLGYVSAYGMLTAVGFDFHEVSFAVPVLAYSVERLLREQWLTAVLFALPLVLIKEDLPMTLAAIGVYLLYQRRYLLGSVVTAFGLLSTTLLVLVVLPALNPDGDYAFQVKFSFSALALGLGLGLKLITLLVLLAPVAFVALRSPLILLTLPTLAWRVASTDPRYWETGFHYDVVLVPIIFFAALDGLRRMRRVRIHLLRYAVPACAVGMALWSLIHLLPKAPQPTWTPAQRTAAENALMHIPEGETVAASNRLAPHLTARSSVQLFPLRLDTAFQPEWIVVAKPFMPWPASRQQQEDQLKFLVHTTYDTKINTSTVVLLHHRRP